MDLEFVKQWINDETCKSGFNGISGVGDFSDIFKILMPIQQKEIRKLCGEDIQLFLDKGSVISMAIFHTPEAVDSINVMRNDKIDYERWNFYADEYNRINDVLNDVCTRLVSIIEGIPIRATLDLGQSPSSVEEYYRPARLSHRVVAEYAGIGSRGKNELIVTKQNGSALRLASFITPITLERSKRIKNLCSDCKACLDVCRILQKKGELRNYRQQCMQKIKTLKLRQDVCGICMKACYEEGRWKKE